MFDPNQALNEIIQPGGLKTSLFPTTSRYHGIETVKMEIANAKAIIYIRRRFLPQPESFSLLHEHVVTEGDRLDNITARYLEDPEQFWRICDANRAMRPDDLTESIGRRLRITLPAGIQGMPNA